MRSGLGARARDPVLSTTPVLSRAHNPQIERVGWTNFTNCYYILSETVHCWGNTFPLFEFRTEVECLGDNGASDGGGNNKRA
jgi:hypothetical protein